ncbi:mCG126335, partial [Mus musculus]
MTTRNFEDDTEWLQQRPCSSLGPDVDSQATGRANIRLYTVGSRTERWRHLQMACFSESSGLHG